MHAHSNIHALRYTYMHANMPTNTSTPRVWICARDHVPTSLRACPRADMYAPFCTSMYIYIWAIPKTLNPTMLTSPFLLPPASAGGAAAVLLPPPFRPPWAATGVLAGLSWSELASTALSSNGLGKEPKWASTRALEGSFAGPLLSYSERTVNTQ